MASPRGQTGRCSLTAKQGNVLSHLPVDLASLSTQQLSQVKKQLDDELEHLTNSFSQLRSAQNKFRECLKSINGGLSPKVEGTLEHVDSVIEVVLFCLTGCLLQESPFSYH